MKCRTLLVLLLLICVSLTARTVLITGFGPFGKHERNSSYEAVKHLHGRSLFGFDIAVLEIPVLWEFSRSMIFHALEQHQPEFVISLGLDENAPASLVLEPFGINRTAYLKDVSGAYPPGREAVPGAPDMLPSALQVQHLKSILVSFGLDAVTGYDAGDYLCGWVYMHLLSGHPSRQVLFTHVHPDAPEHDIAAAVKLLVHALASGTPCPAPPAGEYMLP